MAVVNVARNVSLVVDCVSLPTPTRPWLALGAGPPPTASKNLATIVHVRGEIHGRAGNVKARWSTLPSGVASARGEERPPQAKT